MDPNLLVGYETSDDAAVYRLTDDVAVISTVDFITPPVDDPYWFGQIAAANSLSDVYSMGGKPLNALNLVMFPSKALDMGLLREILRGGHDKVSESGAVLVGGHSVDDEEPKYGLSVVGSVHPDRIVTNAGARPGDALILTKPLGTGVLFNAVRAGKFPYPEMEREILPSVASLNGPAMAVALEFDLHAATDVTGFGIAGHLLEMALGAGVRAHLDAGSLPVHPGALEMYRKGVTTGSNEANRAMAEPHLQMGTRPASEMVDLLFDPQTSGGLLLSLPGDRAADLLSRLGEAGVTGAALVGEFVDGPPGLVVR